MTRSRCPPASISGRRRWCGSIRRPPQLMLSDFVDLKGGDWVIQNVANSAVGRLLIVLAHQRGLRTVNVVRRAELADELKKLGADLVMVDGDDLAGACRARDRRRADQAGRRGDRRRPRPAASSIAWRATARVVHYGSMSGVEPAGRPHELRLSRRQAHRLHAGPVPGQAQRRENPRDLRGPRRAGDGRPSSSAPVDTVYPIDKIKDALAHADKGGRNGKILVSPNGAI